MNRVFALQAGEYAYHANPYAGVTRHAAGAKPGEGTETASKPFKAACHSRYGGDFGRIQVCCSAGC